MGLNIVGFSGRLTKDPELHYTPDGVAVVNYSVAVQRNYKNGNGEYEADFAQCVSWRQTAEFIAEHGRKADKVSVSGKMKTRSFENNEGKMVYVTEFEIDQFNFEQSLNRDENQQTQRGSNTSNRGNSSNSNRGRGNNRSRA